jgi:transmembrane sensor
VEIKDGAALSTDFSKLVRVVTLTRGTAFFHVAKNTQRPFVVRAGGLSVQAVGTAFTVALAEKDLTVLVTEGRVRVDESAASTGAGAAPASPPLASVGAGNSVVVPVAAAIEKAPIVHPVDEIELQEQTGWRIPKLEFTRTPLREVVVQMNQHNQRKFELGDNQVGELRVSGILRADKMDILAESLESDFGVRVEHWDGKIILRRAR